MNKSIRNTTCLIRNVGREKAQKKNSDNLKMNIYIEFNKKGSNAAYSLPCQCIILKFLIKLF